MHVVGAASALDASDVEAAASSSRMKEGSPVTDAAAPEVVSSAETPDLAGEAADGPSSQDDGADSPETLAGTVRPSWNTVVAPAAPVEGGTGEVVFTPPAGCYHPPVNLFLTSATRHAEIRYTQDGSEPGPESPLYERGVSLLLGATVTVRARAFTPGMQPGPVATHTYALQAPEWRVLEPDGGDDPVPHQVHHWDPEHAPGWSLAAASTRGRLHAHRGAWREDAYTFARQGAWSILAVSDGAGSASLSRVGSLTACERAVEELRVRLPAHPPRAVDEESLKAEALPGLRAQLANAGRAALNGLREVAATRGQPVEAFAATLLLAVLCPWDGGHLAAALQVGDGQIALLAQRPDGPAVTLLGEADHGIHSAETRFLTTGGVEQTLEHRVRFALPRHLHAVALMTDGISDDFFPEDRRLLEMFTADSLAPLAARDGAPLRGVLQAVACSADPGRALAEWTEYECKGSSDDRTLLLLWARE
jgi:serine/threonine protein phosphatase PrpC